VDRGASEKEKKRGKKVRKGKKRGKVYYCEKGKGGEERNNYFLYRGKDSS